MSVQDYLSAVKIGKKEYIYMPWNHRVIVPDLKKMYGDIRKKGLEKSYIDFMLNSNGKNASLILPHRHYLS